MPKVISFHYTMTSPEGEEIFSSKEHEPMTYLEGSGQILPSLENELNDMEPGQTKRVEVKSDDAFGDYDENQVIRVEKSQLPVQDVQLGDQFQTDPQSPPLTVIEVGDEHVTMDANHPLAGMDIVFDIELLEVREATSEEIAHGHVHGEGGHHH